jgi:hypothetical protein
MATEKHPWLNKYTATIAANLTLNHAPAVILAILAAITAIFGPRYHAPVALWLGITIVLGFAVALLLVRLLRSDPLPKGHRTEVYGPLWPWYVSAGRLDVSPPLRPHCKNELTLTDRPIWPAGPFISKYPDRYAAHVACSRPAYDYQKTVSDHQSGEDFQSVAELHAAVEKELLRRIDTNELRP